MYSLGLLIGLIALLIAFVTGRRLTAVEVRLARLGEELAALRSRPAPAGTDPRVPPGDRRGARSGIRPGSAGDCAARATGRRPGARRGSTQGAPGHVGGSGGSGPGRARRPTRARGAARHALGGLGRRRWRWRSAACCWCAISIEQGVFGPGVRVALGALFAAGPGGGRRMVPPHGARRCRWRPSPRRTCRAC